MNILIIFSILLPLFSSDEVRVVARPKVVVRLLFHLVESFVPGACIRDDTGTLNSSNCDSDLSLAITSPDIQAAFAATSACVVTSLTAVECFCALVAKSCEDGQDGQLSAGCIRKICAPLPL